MEEEANFSYGNIIKSTYNASREGFYIKEAS